MMHQNVEVNTEGRGMQRFCFVCSLLAFVFLFILVLVLFMGAFVVCNEAVLGNPSGSPISAMCRGIYA